MRTDDFDYNLPSELIAQAPADPRDSARLLVLDRASGKVEHRVFSDIVDYLEAGDLLVANDTRVLPARLLGRKALTGGAAEVLLLKQLGPATWEALVKPGRRLQPGAVVEFRESGADDPTLPVVLTARIVDHAAGRGERVVELEPGEGLTVDAAIHVAGRVPLPPYITQYEGDPEQYQTVYSAREASAAAPTAGLHFTPELIERCRDKGVRWATVDLEVGVDTFRLVDEDDPLDHQMHTEYYTVPQAVVDAVHGAHAGGHRVIAVGTTSTRSLESAWDEGLGDLTARNREATALYILPGYRFHVVDALITNFHVPRSTLLMLVSALAGHQHIMDAYAEAVEQRYRFFSFGDAMLIK